EQPDISYQCVVTDDAVNQRGIDNSGWKFDIVQSPHEASESAQGHVAIELAIAHSAAVERSRTPNTRPIGPDVARPFQAFDLGRRQRGGRLVAEGKRFGVVLFDGIDCAGEFRLARS